MRKYKWGLILAGSLLLMSTSSLLAAVPEAAATLDQTAAPKAPALIDQDEAVIIQALRDLATDRETFALGFDWGERAEYPDRLREYNSQMQAFILAEQYLRLDLYRLQGDEKSAQRTALNIDKLENGVPGTDRQLPRDLPPGEAGVVKGGVR